MNVKILTQSDPHQIWHKYEGQIQSIEPSESHEYWILKVHGEYYSISDKPSFGYLDTGKRPPVGLVGKIISCTFEVTLNRKEMDRVVAEYMFQRTMNKKEE